MIYLVTNAILPGFESPHYKIVTVEESLALLEPLKIVGLDTETMGFDPYTKELLMVQLGCYEFQVVIDCTTINIQQYKEYLESDRLFIGWNIKFDLKFLYHKRIVPKRVYDGFLAEKLMWLGYPAGIHSMSLKSAGENYLGVELDKTVRGKIMWAGLTDEVIVYGANDVKYLEKIMEAQQPELERRGLVNALIYENMSVLWLAYTEYCGVLLDVRKWQEKMELDNFSERVFKKGLNDWVVACVKGRNYAYHYLQTEGVDEEELEKARASMKGERCPEMDIKGETRGYCEAYRVEVKGNIDPKYVGPDIPATLFDPPREGECTINWDSPKQVVPLLLSLGFDLLVQDDETGEMKHSTESKVIEPQQDKSTIAYLYLQYKAARKVTSTYGQNVLNQINERSKRIYTNFNQLGTDTGRLSSGGKDKANGLEYLNFQNFPADPVTRACFISGPGMKWISCDYSGQESRIIADITNDTALLDLFNHGCGDVHSLVAKMSYPDIIGDCPVEEVKKKFKHWRSEAKGVEFAINYGGDANTIKNNKGIPIEEAQKIYDSYMRGFRGMKTYQDRQRRFVMDNGFIILNHTSHHKAYIYDYDLLMRTKARFTREFWEVYKKHKGHDNRKIPKSVLQQLYQRFANGEPFEAMAGVYTYTKKKGKMEETKEVVVTISDVYVHPVRHYFKRKAASEKQAINYPCQGTGAVMFKTASVFLWEYLVSHDLLFKVLLCIPAHDEWNIEVPEEIAEEMQKVLQDCMSRAGSYFCRKLELPADAELSDHWIH